MANLIEKTADFALKRKAALLLGETMKLANQVLPDTMSAKIHVLPRTLAAAVKLDSETRAVAIGMVYQFDSINRNLNRTPRSQTVTQIGEPRDSAQVPEHTSSTLNVQMDEAQFRMIVLDTQVLNTVNFIKWRWDLINEIVEGPLLNPKRLDEAIKATKFVKRLIGFYRPFKYRFSEIKNTKPNQRYVRTGCALMRTLLQNPEGVRYLAENKLLRQIAECLAQLDRVSVLTLEQNHQLPPFLHVALYQSELCDILILADEWFDFCVPFVFANLSIRNPYRWLLCSSRDP